MAMHDAAMCLLRSLALFLALPLFLLPRVHALQKDATARQFLFFCCFLFFFLFKSLFSSNFGERERERRRCGFGLVKHVEWIVGPFRLRAPKIEAFEQQVHEEQARSTTPLYS